MGMTIPGMTTGAAAPVAGGKAVGTVSAVGGATAIFGQSLQQLMGNSLTTVVAAETIEMPTNPLLSALQQLIAAAVETTEEGSELNLAGVKQLEVKLEKLTEQLDALDEQLTENQELMSMLQGWIQQAQTLLGAQEESAEQNEGQQQTVNVVETLASNPSTLKFALQDMVVQLIELQQSNEAAPQMKIQAQQVLAALEQTVKQVENNVQQMNVQQASIQQTSVQPSEHPQMNLQQGNSNSKATGANLTLEGKPVQQDIQVVKNEPAGFKQALEVQPKAMGEQANAVSKNQAQQSGAGIQQEGQLSEEAPQEFKLQGTVTAGELALRTNGLMPAKPIEAVPVHRMAQEVEKLVVERLEILQKQGFTEAKISLTPDHLGKVDIRITMQAGQLIAHFVTEHAAAKDMLEQQMTQLRGSLQGQGLTVERLEVTQSSSLQSQMDQNGGQTNGREQQERRSRTREEANDDAKLTAELGEELGEWLRQKTAAQSGSSFIAEA